MITNCTLLTKTKNPFINLVILAHNKNIELNKNLADTFLSFLENDLHKKHDLNEKIYLSGQINSYYNDHSEQKIFHTDFFFLLSSLNTTISSFEFNQFFNKVISYGLDISRETDFWFKTNEDKTISFETINQIEPTKTDSIFSDLNSEHRNLYLFAQLFKSIPQEEYQRRIQHYNVYHTVCLRNFISNIDLLNQQRINPNLININLKTPLMYCNKISTVEIMHKYGANWLLKDIEGNDALYYFNKNSNPIEQVALQNYSHKKIADSIKTIPQIDVNYVANRLKKSLCELVKGDETKAVLMTYIKKNKITDIQTILDENNNNLAMISLKNNNWSRFDLFNSCDLSQKNKFHENCLHILLQKGKNLTYEDKIAPIYFSMMKNYYQVIDDTLGNLMIEKSFNHFQPGFPSWFVKNSTAIELLFNKIGFNSEETEKFINKIKLFDKITNEEKTALFYDTYTQIQNQFPDTALVAPIKIINSILEKPNTYSKEYTLSDDKLKQLICFLESINNIKDSKNNSYFSDFLDILETESIQFFKEGYGKSIVWHYTELPKEEFKRLCQSSFCKKIEPLLEFFVKQGKTDIFSHLSEDFLYKEDWNLTIQKGIQFNHLNKKLSNKTNKTNKRTYKI